MQLSFEDRTVLVTGGSCGIGAAVSIAFAGAGARVAVNHLPIERDEAGFNQVQKTVAEFGGTCMSLPGDITDPKACEEMCRKTAEDFGSLDIIVNSAGYMRPASTEETTDKIWETGISVNLSAAFYMTRAAIPYLTKKPGGRIIFIGSAGAITGGGGAPFYSAAKAGINGLVRYLSKDLAPKGITVNAVLPALIETDMLRERYSDPEKRKAVLTRIPVGRLGQPEDVANLTLFLASEQAGYICGQQMIVDGGSTYK